MTILEGAAISLPIDNIDTDRIIPARFLTTTDRTGLGRRLFEDWREGKDTLGASSSILVAGHNFGCGSSREHAVWALVDSGFRVVISTGFADIFYANSVRNGLVPVVLDPEDHARLVAALEQMPDSIVTLDFDAERLRCGAVDAGFTAGTAPTDHDGVPGGAELEILLEALPDIEDYETGRRCPIDTRGGHR